MAKDCGVNIIHGFCSSYSHVQSLICEENVLKRLLKIPSFRMSKHGSCKSCLILKDASKRCSIRCYVDHLAVFLSQIMQKFKVHFDYCKFTPGIYYRKKEIYVVIVRKIIIISSVLLLLILKVVPTQREVYKKVNSEEKKFQGENQKLWEYIACASCDSCYSVHVCSRHK